MTIATARGADGKALFTLELARFGHDIALRASSPDAQGVMRPGTWQVIDLEQHLLSFAWQAAASGNDGYLKVGAASPTQVALGASAERAAVTKLWVTVQNSVPWLVLISQ